jgi:hypothetical protein
MIEIVAIDTPSLGDRTYLATDGTSALVVDPQRDIDRVLAAAAARAVDDNFRGAPTAGLAITGQPGPARPRCADRGPGHHRAARARPTAG